MRRVSGYALDGALVLVTYRRLERDARRPETGVVQAASMAGAPVSVGSCRFAADPLLQRHQDWDDLRVSVSLPDNAVNVIAVGGTYVWMAEDGTYIHEAAWEEHTQRLGDRGGLSTKYARPSWQVGVGVDNAESNGMRQVPDVAGQATR